MILCIKMESIFFIYIYLGRVQSDYYVPDSVQGAVVQFSKDYLEEIGKFT